MNTQYPFLRNEPKYDVFLLSVLSAKSVAIRDSDSSVSSVKSAIQPRNRTNLRKHGVLIYDVITAFEAERRWVNEYYKGSGI